MARYRNLYSSRQQREDRSFSRLAEDLEMLFPRHGRCLWQRELELPSDLGTADNGVPAAAEPQGVHRNSARRNLMIKKRTVKVIKRPEPTAREPQSGAESDGGSNIWSKSVRLWVDQYRQASAERLPAFDRLFKNSQPAEQPVPLND